METNDITYKIIGRIYQVYNNLGPGLLESVYEEALFYELEHIGLHVKRQAELPVFYDGIQLGSTMRLDLLVEDRVIVELKSVEELKKVHFKQLQTYLKLARLQVGLLVNFNTADIRQSIHRVHM